MKPKEIVQAILAVGTYIGLFAQMFYLRTDISVAYWGMVLGWSGVYGWKAIKG